VPDDTPATARPTKAYVLAKLMGSGGIVCVALDARVKGVDVPKSLKKNPQVMFQLGLNMPVPIRDLQITDVGWSAVLSFNSGFSRCLVPWAAVYTIFDLETKNGMTWPEDIPPEVTYTVEEHEEVDAKVVRKTLPPGWRVLDGGRKDSEPEDSGAA
jgi:stringent starvation protein B